MKTNPSIPQSTKYILSFAFVLGLYFTPVGTGNFMLN